MAELTPMRKQYLETKEKYPDCLLFFRLGDFYEMFDDDARIASKELDLTLTTRDRNKNIPKEQRVPMCGVPYHSYEAYLARLVAKGYKVAICEQMEDPANAQGTVVERDVIRIVTPGTVVDASMLEEGRNNYIAAVYLAANQGGVCFCDISTGELSCTGFSGEETVQHIINEFGRFQPREVVLSEGAAEEELLVEVLTNRLECRIERSRERRFNLEKARELIEKQFENPSAMPQSQNEAARAVGALLNYLYETQKSDLGHIRTLNYYSTGRFMELDLTARRNLELTETLRGKEKRGSLLWVLDKTRTAMGGRLLRSWLEKPLLNPVDIDRRLSAVEELVDNLVLREELVHILREITDLERLISRIVYGSANGRDLVALSAGLHKVPLLREQLEGCKAPMLKAVLQRLDPLEELIGQIDHAIVDEPPFTVREGGIIREGYSEDVDYLRNVMTHGKDMVADIENRTKENCGIKNLRVKYNKVFGYFIEVSKGQADLVPADWVRKQTTVNSERFINQELKELEHTILSAQDKITGIEYELFTELRQMAAAQVEQVQQTAQAIGEVDVLCSMAAVAVENGYCRPEVDDSSMIQIADGRHPVVEKVLKNAMFVPNDTMMDCEANALSIITGPNMAGKSTYMRQVALICLMAQVGSFVPARQARIGVLDRIFTRIGASDDLSSGQSTFMVEMAEVADILKNATSRSLLILDEIGRGTSTYDGMSIARAVLEYCVDRKRLGAKTLFATHYHELTVLEGQLKGVKNYNIAAKKRSDDIIFLRKIVRGGADQSYGIEVAKLAGVPTRVITRARTILAELEGGEDTGESVLSAAQPQQQPMEEQCCFGDIRVFEVAEELRNVDINTLTPIEAMNLIYQWKQKL